MLMCLPERGHKSGIGTARSNIGRSLTFGSAPFEDAAAVRGLDVRSLTAVEPPDDPADYAMGGSGGGFGSKSHVVTDGAGNPLAIEVTAGQVHESTRVESVNGQAVALLV